MLNDTFKALGDPVRLEILNLLREKKMNAGEIAAHFSLSQASISYHLKLLKEAQLIREEKVKNFIYYEINLSVFEEMIFWLQSLKGGHSHE